MSEEELEKFLVDVKEGGVMDPVLVKKIACLLSIFFDRLCKAIPVPCDMKDSEG